MTYMGWFDNRDVPLSQKIRDAMNRHEQKYGPVPNLVLLPLNEGSVEGLNIEVHRDRYILPYHILVGVKE